MNVFNSKVLLFGEYSIILNSSGLAIPYRLFEGKLKIDPKQLNYASNKELKSLSRFLNKLTNEGKLDFLDIDNLEFDINKGLYFDSTIPEGYGLGSSGALTAAIYHHYLMDNSLRESDYTSKELLYLKSRLAMIENHFHGESSGFDPLLSYVSRPLLIKGNGDIEIVEVDSSKKGSGAIFIVDTSKSRRTEPLVNLFLEKLKNDTFKYLVKNDLSEINNNCIKQFLSHDYQNLMQEFFKLSHFQYEHFIQMIPPTYRKLWLRGLEEKSYALKLCGAGGGGFILGMTTDLEHAKKELAGEEVRTLFRF